MPVLLALFLPLHSEIWPHCVASNSSSCCLQGAETPGVCHHCPAEGHPACLQIPGLMETVQQTSMHVGLVWVQSLYLLWVNSKDVTVDPVVRAN